MQPEKTRALNISDYYPHTATNSVTQHFGNTHISHVVTAAAGSLEPLCAIRWADHNLTRRFIHSLLSKAGDISSMLWVVFLAVYITQPVFPLCGCWEFYSSTIIIISSCGCSSLWGSVLAVRVHGEAKISRFFFSTIPYTWFANKSFIDQQNVEVLVISFRNVYKKTLFNMEVKEQWNIWHIF